MHNQQKRKRMKERNRSKNAKMLKNEFVQARQLTIKEFQGPGLM